MGYEWLQSLSNIKPILAGSFRPDAMLASMKLSSCLLVNFVLLSCIMDLFFCALSSRCAAVVKEAWVCSTPWKIPDVLRSIRGGRFGCLVWKVEAGFSGCERVTNFALCMDFSVLELISFVYLLPSSLPARNS